MEITFYGTRGSLPVSGKEYERYGGNTTCLRVASDCLPEGRWLFIDTGSGARPAARAFVQAQGKAATILFTHYHPDHVEGFGLSVLPFIDVPITLYGPYEHGVGPREAVEHYMVQPFFPVGAHSSGVGHHLDFKPVKVPACKVIAIHPIGGVKELDTDEFERLTRAGKQLLFPPGKKFAKDECLVIRMHHSNHPERTISYRFEEGPTRKTFVFMTDNENLDGVPKSLKDHIRGADLFVVDCQYDRKKYDTFTAGWGHGTPDNAARLASYGVKVLGLTHHDPDSTDDHVDTIVESTKQQVRVNGSSIEVFGCRDHMTVTV